MGQMITLNSTHGKQHDDVIEWKHFPRYWPFVRGIHRSPVNSPHKGQWRGALMFSLICVWVNDWVNNCEAGDLRRYRAHYDVTLMRYAKNPTMFTHIFEKNYLLTPLGLSQHVCNACGLLYIMVIMRWKYYPKHKATLKSFVCSPWHMIDCAVSVELKLS